jgi:hypothetical protein
MSRGSHPANPFLLSFVAAATLACTRVPSSAYEWHPVLSLAKGDVDSFVRNLPLGSEVSRAQHPHREQRMVLSNEHALFPFVDDPSLVGEADQPHTWSRVVYEDKRGKSDGDAPNYAFVYAALLRESSKRQATKDSMYSGSPGFLTGDMQRRLAFAMCRVEGLLQPQEPAKAFLAKGEMSFGGGVLGAVAAYAAPKLNYLDVVYTRRNFYLEVAVRDDSKYGDCAEASSEGALPTVKGMRDSAAWQKILLALESMGFRDLATASGD